jgi:hypothetical protein
MDPEIQAALDRVTCELKNEVYEAQRLAHRIKYDVKDLCLMATVLLALLGFNSTLVVVCLSQVNHISRSLDKIQASQTEVKR